MKSVHLVVNYDQCEAYGQPTYVVVHTTACLPQPDTQSKCTGHLLATKVLCFLYAGQPVS